MKRKIVHIDENLCNGCGLCVPNCAEGAIQVIDGKAKLVAENLCDGLGACLGECPEGAIRIEEREADEFDEKVVEKHLKSIGREPAPAHGGHHGPGHHAGGHHDHGAGHHAHHEGGHHGHPHHEHHGGGCPSSRMMQHERPAAAAASAGPAGAVASELAHWPIKLQLVPPTAPFFKGKELLVAADCAPAAFGDFQRRYLKGAAIVLQCPKFGDQEFVIPKLAGIIAEGGITGLTILRMEVPCCGGLSWAVQKAIQASGRTDLPVREVVVGVRGDVVSERSATTGIPVQG